MGRNNRWCEHIESKSRPHSGHRYDVLYCKGNFRVKLSVAKSAKFLRKTSLKLASFELST